MAPSRAATLKLAILTGSLISVNAATTSTGIGEYVIQGLGQSSISSAANNSSNGTLITVTSPLYINGTSTVTASPVFTGSGLVYASNCLASSHSFWSARNVYYSSEYSLVGTVPTPVTSTYMETAIQQNIQTCSAVTRLTTLCDGHPRVVGNASCTATYESYTASGTTTYLMAPTIPDYTETMTSCSVQPSDCQQLYTLSPSFVWNSSALLSWCSFTTSQTATYSTNSVGEECQNCQIVARSARLLYWPVRTASVPGPDNLCANTSVRVFGGTSTGTGPNTFVTDGVTITSPSVGISLADVSRADGCFQTISSTVLIIPPNEVTSARGARALFTWAPFDFQDLNYRCQDPGSDQYIIQDEPGPDCYQDVPATAYFAADRAFDDYGENLPLSFSRGFTIGPDYHPQVLPPLAWTEWANKLYNTTDCLVHPDGVWDPPIALTTVNSEFGVTFPGSHSTTTTSSDAVWTTSTAVPAESIIAGPSQTMSHSGQPSTHPSSSIQASAEAHPSSNAVSSQGTPQIHSFTSTTVIVTVFTISSGTWTQVSSDASHIMLTSGGTTSTFDPDDPALSAARTTTAVSIVTPTSLSPSAGPGVVDEVKTITATVFTMSSNTWTQVSTDASHIVLALSTTTSTFVRDDPALSNGITTTAVTTVSPSRVTPSSAAGAAVGQYVSNYSTSSASSSQSLQRSSASSMPSNSVSTNADSGAPSSQALASSTVEVQTSAAGKKHLAWHKARQVLSCALVLCIALAQ